MIRSVRLRDGATDAVEVDPVVFGPGERFNLKLSFQTGVDGYYDIAKVIYGTGTLLWPDAAYPHPFRNPPPKRYFRAHDVRLLSSKIELEGLEVPAHRPLDAADVTLHVLVSGTRPEVLAGENEPRRLLFSEEYEIAMKLGHGLILPTGWTNIHAYNRQTWALVAFAGLAVIYALIYSKPRRKHLDLPYALRHETHDT